MTTNNKQLKFNKNVDLRQPTPDRLKYLKEQVIRLMDIPQPEQRSSEWYIFRDSMLTASDWGTILGMNHYSNPNQLLLKKCGKDIPFPSNAAIDWGVKYEDVAVQIYEKRNSEKILLFGCIRHPTINFLGASPDGISENGVMLEIKCPSSRQITGIIPEHYWCQVQAQLEVCELDRCDFLECNIKEYDTKNNYLNDNFNGDYSKNNIGFEKGCVIDFFDKNIKKKVFIYSPIGIVGEELDNWIEDTKTNVLKNNINYFYEKISFWTLQEISCIPIYRNQEWFNEAYFKLKDFWEKILYWRKKGLFLLEEFLEEEKINKKKLKEKNKVVKKTKNNNNVYISLDNFIPSNNNKDDIIKTPSKNNLFSNFEFSDDVKIIDNTPSKKTTIKSPQNTFKKNNLFSNFEFSDDIKIIDNTPPKKTSPKKTPPKKTTVKYPQNTLKKNNLFSNFEFSDD